MTPIDGLVSIIIPTRSRPRQETLDSIARQTYPDIEVVVVNVGRERSSQTNEGARRAKGDYFYRVDDDFLLEPDVVEKAVAACRAGADGVLVHNTSDPTISRWSKVRKVERDCFRDDPENSFARFVTRSAFQAIGGFNEDLYADEDREFNDRLLRAGFRIVRIDAREIHLGEPRKLEDVVRTYRYYGGGFDAYIRRYGVKSITGIGLVRRAHIRHWRELVADPKVFAELLLYQYVKYVSEVAGFLAKRMSSGQVQARVFEDLVPAPKVAAVVTTIRDPSKIAMPRTDLRVVVKGGPSLAWMRNQGWRSADTDLVLFYDDDNVPNARMVDELVKAFRLDPRIAVVSPVIYYLSDPGSVWFAGGRFDSITGVLSVRKDAPRSYRFTETFHDVFMVRKAALLEVGGFDEKWFPFYLGEADWAERARKLGWRFVVAGRAKVWHAISHKAQRVRQSHIANVRRAYFVGRNKLIFLRRHRSLAALLFHSTFVLPFIVSKNLASIASSRRFDFFRPYLLGVIDGLRCRTAFEPVQGAQHREKDEPGGEQREAK